MGITCSYVTCRELVTAGFYVVYVVIVYQKSDKSHTNSEQTVKKALNLQIFFIYILNYQEELGKITVLIKF